MREARDDLHLRAAERLFLWVVTGRFGTPPRLPTENELGTRLGVSRTVVREAVKGLAAKSVLRTRRRTGTIVLDRADWNMLDADLIGWLRRAGQPQDVSPMLFEAIASAEEVLAGLAARTRSGAEVLSAAQRVGRSDADWHLGEVLLAIASAGTNLFLASLVRKCLGALVRDDPGFVESWQRAIGPERCEAVGLAILAGDESRARVAAARLFAPDERTRGRAEAEQAGPGFR